MIFKIGADPWGHSLKLLMAAVVGGGGLVMGLMAYMQREVRLELYYLIMYIFINLFIILFYLLIIF